MDIRAAVDIYEHPSPPLVPNVPTDAINIKKKKKLKIGFVRPRSENVLIVHRRRPTRVDRRDTLGHIIIHEVVSVFSHNRGKSRRAPNYGRRTFSTAV